MPRPDGITPNEHDDNERFVIDAIEKGINRAAQRYRLALDQLERGVPEDEVARWVG
jgi:hypothetical protein